MNSKKAQIWVESVLYTLIGLAIIGVLMIAIRPTISKTQDEFIIQQTVKALHEIDNKVIEIKQATGNKRIVQFQLTKGDLTIDANNDRIVWNLRSSGYMYSEPGFETAIGNIKVLTEKNVDKYDIQLTLDYGGNTDIKIDKGDIIRVLQPVKTAYSLILENNGPDPSSGLIQIDISAM